MIWWDQMPWSISQGPSSQGYVFSSSHVWMWELDHRESWALKDWCFWTVVLEKTLESSLDSKEIKPVNPKGNQVLSIHWKDRGWTWSSNTLATWCEELTHWKRPWCWERWKAGGEEDDRGWDSWMASLTQWTWVWASSGSWWWMGKPGVLQSMGLQRVRHNWVTELSLMKYESEVAQLCPTLCDPMDCSPPGSSIHGILWARILEWVAISFSRGSSWPRDQTQVALQADTLTSEPPGKPSIICKNTKWLCCTHETNIML